MPTSILGQSSHGSRGHRQSAAPNLRPSMLLNWPSSGRRSPPPEENPPMQTRSEIARLASRSSSASERRPSRCNPSSRAKSSRSETGRGSDPAARALGQEGSVEVSPPVGDLRGECGGEERRRGADGTQDSPPGPGPSSSSSRAAAVRRRRVLSVGEIAAVPEPGCEERALASSGGALEGDGSHLVLKESSSLSSSLSSSAVRAAACAAARRDEGLVECRICHLDVADEAGGECGRVLKLECGCWGGAMAVVHHDCAQLWWSFKGDRFCEICGDEVANLPPLLQGAKCPRWRGGLRLTGDQSSTARADNCPSVQPREFWAGAWATAVFTLTCAASCLSFLLPP